MKETKMADDSGSSAVLGVLVGALIVGAILFFVFVGFPGGGGSGSDVDVSIDAPAPSIPAPTPSGG
jgi:hypothetical protein